MYIGNDLQIAHPSYKIIDDISSGFNGSTTSFALQVSGATPVPFPISTQQVMISVNGVVQEPDPTGSAGFKLLGSNIVFSSAPANGHAFFGVINAGADYVTAGSEFPDGSATAPSFTFQDDQDTGWFRSGSGAVGYSANGSQTLTFDGNGLTVTGDASFVGDSSKNLLWDKSDGALEFADNAKAVFGAGSDLSIYHDPSTNHSFIKETGAGSLVINANDFYVQNVATETMIKAASDGAVELYHNNVRTFDTDSNGIRVFGPEGGHAYIHMYADEGDDNADKFWLKVANDGTGFNIENYVSGSTETNLRAVGDGAVELYHNNVKIFETFADGITVRNANNSNAQIQIFADNGDDNADKWRIEAETSGNFEIANYSTGSWVNALIVDSPGRLGLKTSSMSSYNGSADDLVIDNGASDVGITLDSEAQCSIAFTDSAKTGWDGWMKYIHSSNSLQFGSGAAAALTLNSSQNATFAGTVSDSKGDLRKIPINAKSSSYTLVSSDAGKTIRTDSGVTVPAGIFYEGEAITIYNNSGSDITITQGSNQTMYNAADAATGNRTLAGRGLCTVLCVSNNVFVISGAGLS